MWDIVSVSGAEFVRVLILTEGLQLTEFNLGARGKIQVISYHTSLKNPMVQSPHMCFLSVFFLPSSFRAQS